MHSQYASRRLTRKYESAKNASLPELLQNICSGLTQSKLDLFRDI